MKTTTPVRQRLDAKTMTDPASGCILWTGTRHGNGYGHINIDGRMVLVHRVAWSLAHGCPVPDGMLVLHRCDTPSCVNPDHLWIGTQLDNMRDCSDKGRCHEGDKNGSRTHPECLARGDRSSARLHPESYRGERNGAAKISDAAADELRRRAQAGENYRLLAAEFGVSRSLVSLIKTGKKRAR
jgi:hypothetical protein